jgi:hypothetical protein
MYEKNKLVTFYILKKITYIIENIILNEKR